jgi:hypothetical protein
MRSTTLSILLSLSLLSSALAGCTVQRGPVMPPPSPSDQSGLPPPPPPGPAPAPQPAPDPQPIPPPEPAPLPRPIWDSTGWTMLGEHSVDGRRDRDRIQVGRDEGRFRQLTMVVIDSELELIELEIKFGNGKPFRPNVAHYFRENSRTRVIDLPGDSRVIKHIDLRYKNLPGGGRARVQVWAR